MTTLTRRQTLAGATLLAASALLPTALTAQDLTTLRIAYAPGIYSLAIAEAQGYFAAEGLQLQLIPLATGTETIAAVRGGSADLAYADTFAGVNAIHNGFDVTLIQGANHTSQSVSYLVRADSDIQSPADLRGRNIGIGGVPFFRVFAHKFLEAHDIAPTDVSFTVIRQSSALPEALQNGAIDAIQSNGQSVFYLNDGRGSGYTFRRVGDPNTAAYQNPNAVQAAYWSTAQWAAAEQDTAQAFVRAYRNFARWFNALGADERADLALEFDRIDYRAIAAGDQEILENLVYLNAARYVEGPVDIAATQEWIDQGAAIAPDQVPEAIRIDAHLLPEAR